METLVAQFVVVPDGEAGDVDVDFVGSVEEFFRLHEGTVPEVWSVLEGLLESAVYPQTVNLVDLMEGRVRAFWMTPDPPELRRAMIDWASDPDNAGALANCNLFIPTGDSETAP